MHKYSSADGFLSCRCGFAGETGPRFIIPSEIRKPGQQHVRHHCTFLRVIFLMNVWGLQNMFMWHMSCITFRQSKWFSTTSTQKSFMPSSKSLSIYCTSGKTAALGHCEQTYTVFGSNNKRMLNQLCVLICLNQTPAGEPSRQKSGHHRVHPLPISLQGDPHKGFLQAVWGIRPNGSVFYRNCNTYLENVCVPDMTKLFI